MAQPVIGRLITGGPPARSKPQRILESHHKVTNAIHKVTDHLPRHGALQTMAAVLPVSASLQAGVRTPAFVKLR